LTILAVYFVTIKPGRAGETNWTSQTLLILAAALYLKFSEKFKRLRAVDAPRSQSWRERQAQLAEIIERLIRMKGRDRSRPERILSVQTSILACIVSSISELLDEPADAFCASLLVFPGSRSESEATPTRMVVAARSSAIRALGVDYPCNDDLIAWKAIVENDVKVVDDIQKCDHFVNTRKSYRSVLAIPVTIGGNALGSLSIDSRNAYQFVNRQDDLAFLVRPYISLLAYTFPTDAVSVTCSYRNTHMPPSPR
jgi:hypothetical protein